MPIYYEKLKEKKTSPIGRTKVHCNVLMFPPDHVRGAEIGAERAENRVSGSEAGGRGAVERGL